MNRRFLSFALSLLFVFTAETLAEESAPKFHGPLIQWHRDPATSATFVWVEKIAPERPRFSIFSSRPEAKPSAWSIGVRRRGTGASFVPLEIEERDFAKTGNPVFFARAEGLGPGTAYDYLLSANERRIKTGWFRTAPSELRKAVHFVEGGDMGTDTAVPVCKLAGREDPLFAMVGGDLAYANGRDASRWYDWIDNWTNFIVSADGRSIPMIIGIGNHEMKGLTNNPSNAPFYFSLFDLPAGRTNFTVDFSDYMSIVLLDTDHTQKVGDQTGWLEQQLRERKRVKHLFVVYHRPAWGTGIKPNRKDVREEWCPLFEKYQVDCVFEHDHHVYKRTHRLTGGRRDDTNGILYLGDGAWGAKLRPIAQNKFLKPGTHNYLACSKSIHHLIKVTVSPDGSRRYEAKAPDNSTFDRYRDPGARR